MSNFNVSAADPPIHVYLNLSNGIEFDIKEFAVQTVEGNVLLLGIMDYLCRCAV